MQILSRDALLLESKAKKDIMKLKDIILKQKGNVKTYFQGDMNQIEKQ